jgi:hypothetical protein
LAYDIDTVMKRDNRTCRLRFPGCRRRATRIMLRIPPFLGGGEGNDAAVIATCHHCYTAQQEQRQRAAQLFDVEI